MPNIEQVKRDLPFSNTDEDQQMEPAYYGNLKPKKPELKGGFLSLSQKGIKIKDEKNTKKLLNIGSCFSI